MTPRPLPQKYASKWKTWPTLDELRDANDDLKLHQLREALKDVPCYRCEDKSVRYVPSAVRAAMLDMPGDDDNAETAEDVDPDELARLSRSSSMLSAADALLIIRESSRNLTEARRERRETIQALEDDRRKTIAEMMEPMRLGLSLTSENVKMLEGRLKHYDSIWDRMIQTTERLMSEQTDRELAAQRSRDMQEVRKQALGMAMEHLPSMVANFKPSAVASLALDAFKSLEPEMIDALLNAGTLEPTQFELFSKLRAALTPQPKQDQHAGNNGQSHGPS